VVDVFISYRRAQRSKVEPIKDRLEALGLKIFFDVHGIDGGVNFPSVIDTNLRAAKAVLACWSPAYFQQKPHPDWCMVECRFGMGQNKLVPVAVEHFAGDAPPVDMHGINWFDLTSWRGQNEHEDWRRTLDTLFRHTGRKPEAQRLSVPPAPVPEFVKPSGPAKHIIDDLRAQWAELDKSNSALVAQFREHVHYAAPNTNLEIQVEYHLNALLAKQPPARTERERSEAETGTRVAARSQPGSVWRDAIPGLSETACPEMVTIPPGKFLMGSPKTEERSKNYDGREEPQHEVRIDYAFALGKYAVTFAEWDAAIAAGAKLEKPSDQGWGRDRRPVINVNWDDATAYIAWLNGKLGLEGRRDAYRLPSEAEWEYACRAGTTTPFSFGATISTAQANYNGNSTYGAGKEGEYRQKTTPVGSFQPNAFGLHDMHGNVWEWCEDLWNANYNGAPTDGSAWLTGGGASGVLRGGSSHDIAEGLRSACRYGCIVNYRNFYLGFRVARSL
jgi:formylglycine-generating enzyme required for sulfatase activity